jgi:hypothetical protein
MELHARLLNEPGIHFMYQNRAIPDRVEELAAIWSLRQYL